MAARLVNCIRVKYGLSERQASGLSVSRVERSVTPNSFGVLGAMADVAFLAPSPVKASLEGTLPRGVGYAGSAIFRQNGLASTARWD